MYLLSKLVFGTSYFLASGNLYEPSFISIGALACFISVLISCAVPGAFKSPALIAPSIAEYQACGSSKDILLFSPNIRFLLTLSICSCRYSSRPSENISAPVS